MATQLWPADHVERWHIDRLIPYAKNARTHTQAQVAQIAGLITELGWTTPVLVDPSGSIIAGHGRVMAAKSLGIEQVPVMVAVGWSEAQVRAYRIADNKAALNAGWDMDLLSDELRDLCDDIDLSLTGFSDDELQALIGESPPEDPPDERIPPLEFATITRAGEIWRLGAHRLMCGDCRRAEDVDALIGHTAINVAFTSPPYAEQRAYDASSGFRPIPPDDYVAWFEPVAANVAQHLAGDGSWFVNIKPSGDGLDTPLYVFDLVIAHARAWGWHFATEFCWERPGVPKGVTQRFKNAFEPIYQFARARWKMRPEAVRHPSDNVPQAGGKGVGDTSWDTGQGNGGSIFGAANKRRNGQTGRLADWQGANAVPGEFISAGLAFPSNRLPTFTASHDATGHAAAFPVGLPEFFIRAFTDKDDAVFDPFSGSGSTLMACERTQRAGFAMEISPAYCDITVKRWQNATGGVATLDATGESFEDVTRARLPG